jgi:hypothetical protein
VRAIVWRAYDLGMIDAAQYRTANIHLVRTGQAKGETGDNDWPWPEEPELLATSLALLEAGTPGAFVGLASTLELKAESLADLVGIAVSAAEDSAIETTAPKLRLVANSIFRDWTGEMRPEGREVVERALGHTIKDKAEAAYARSDLVGKKDEQ